MANESAVLGPVDVWQEQFEADAQQAPGRGFINDLASNKYVRTVAAVGAGLLPGVFEEAASAKQRAPIASSEQGLYTSISPEALTAASSYESQDVIAKKQLSAIPGFNVTLKQAFLETKVVDGKVVTSYACPAPTAMARISIASVETLPNNQANVNFCPSDSVVKVSRPANDSTYRSALAKFLGNPLLAGEWGGDKYDKTLYTICPQLPKQHYPRISFKYKPKNDTVTAKYIAGNHSEYCAEVGQYTGEATAQVKKPGSKQYIDVGRSVVRVSGLREILLYGGYGLSGKNEKDTVVLPEIDDLCDKYEGTNLKMRIKLKERFQADPAQDFQHDSKGRSDKMRSGTATYYSSAREVC